MKKLKQNVVLGLALSCMVAMSGCKADVKEESTQTKEPSITQEVTPTQEVTESVTQEAQNSKDFAGLTFDHHADLLYATEFTLDYYKDGYKTFTIESNHPGQKFLIVPEGKEIPEGLDDTTTVLCQPLDKITFHSTGAVSLISAIDGLDHIVGVGTDLDGWYIDDVVERLNDGRIQFTGKYSAPDYEMLTADGTQLIVDTTMLNSHPEIAEKYKELNIPLVIENSSKESTPLGRVEWIKLYAALMNLEDEAEAYFNEQIKIVEEVQNVEKTDKTVAMFYTSSKSDKNYVRNAGDYMAAMVELAGGNYILSDLNKTEGGTTELNSEELYAKCSQADYVIYINFAKEFTSLQEMIDSNDLYKDYKAVKDGNVFITSPDYTQSVASIADIISDIHKVLVNPDDTSVTMITKLK